MVYRRELLFVVILISMLLLLMLAGLVLVSSVKANPDFSSLVFAMPEEYVNYTITRVNGTLWAKIDGVYPIHVLTVSEGSVHCVLHELQMYYPTPPATTNINVMVNETNLDWQYYPYKTHHTAIGDWSIIRCVVAHVSEHFTLKIHYEHPVQVINGSYLFLYDLNIRSYLSPWSPTSTAYFTVRFELEVSDLQAFTTATDNNWKPIGYEVSQEGATEVMRLRIHSEYEKPLSGDLVVQFSLAETETKAVPSWTLVPVFLVVILIISVAYRKLKRA